MQVTELGCKFGDRAPIRLRVSVAVDPSGCPRRMLCDRIDAGATWVVAVDPSDEVVACGRVQLPRDVDPLEMSRYPACPGVARKLMTEPMRRGTTEVNRYVVRRSFRKTMLATAISRVLHHQGRGCGAVRMISSTNRPAAVRLLSCISAAPLFPLCEFKHEERDAEPVQVYVVDIASGPTRALLERAGVALHQVESYPTSVAPHARGDAAKL